MIDTSLDAINLKGFLVGNGATDWDFDVSPSFPETAYNFNVIPKRMLDKYQEGYCVEYFNDFKPFNGTDPEACNATMQEIVNLTKNLNWYDLYRHKYPDGLGLESDQDERMGVSYVGGEERTYKRGYTFGEYTPWLKNHPGAQSKTVLGAFVTDYINNATTREALHIPEEVQPYE